MSRIVALAILLGCFAVAVPAAAHPALHAHDHTGGSDAALVQADLPFRYVPWILAGLLATALLVHDASQRRKDTA